MASEPDDLSTSSRGDNHHDIDNTNTNEVKEETHDTQIIEIQPEPLANKSNASSSKEKLITKEAEDKPPIANIHKHESPSATQPVHNTQHDTRADTKNGIIDIKISVLPNAGEINKKQTSSSKSKSISSKMNKIKQRFSNKMDSIAFEIEDTDSNDDLEEEENFKAIELQNVNSVKSRYDDDAFGDLPYEEEVIERLSIALTYLLHEESPLWTNDDRDADEYDQDLMNSLVAPKHNKSKDEDGDDREYKAPPSFQQKCTEYTTNDNIISGLRSAQRKLNKLYKIDYRSKWKSLHRFWVKWKLYEQDKKESEPHEDEQKDFEDLVVVEADALEDDCDDFLQKFEEAMVDIMKTTSTMGRAASIRRESNANAFDKFVKHHTDRAMRDFKMQDPTLKYKAKSGKGGISSSYTYGDTPKSGKLAAASAFPSKPNTPNKSPQSGAQKSPNTPDLQTDSIKTMNNLFTKEQELRSVQTRGEMKRWITKYKDDNFKWGWHHNNDNNNEITTMYDLDPHQAAKSNTCTQWINSVKAIFHREEFHKEVPLHLPMYAWTWQHLVSFIESEEQYKRFSSIFWEYRINGQEICNMKSKQIELLIECSVLNNSKVFESEFDKFKLAQSSRNSFYSVDAAQNSPNKKSEWEITLAANELYEYIVKGRVESQIVSRYYTAWDIVMQVANSRQHKSSARAQNIRDLVALLRAQPADGPKQFWKVDAVFFNKIDNYLMALIGRGSVRSIFQRYWPYFLHEEEIEANTPTEHNTPEHNIAPAHSPHMINKASTSIVTHHQHMNNASNSMYHSALSPNQNRQSFLSKGLAFKSHALLQHQYQSTVSMPSTTPGSKASLPSYSKASVITTSQPHISEIPPAKTMGESPLPSRDLSMLNEYKYDVLDKCADCLCKERCKQWVHNLDRIYLGILCVVIVSLIVGCTFCNLWYFFGASEQTTNAMKLAMQAIGDRTSDQLAFQFWVPQLFTAYLITGLHTNVYPVNASKDTDGQYDLFFASVLQARHTSHLFSVYMYNVDENLMLGSYVLDNNTIISTRINNCKTNYVFDFATGSRLDPNKTCDEAYFPTQRPWFIQSQQMELSASEWTEPYMFSSFNGYGMTLITRMQYEGTEIVLLVEITMYTLDNVISVNHLPVDTVLFVITPQHSVISATNDELVLQNITVGSDSESGDSTDELECDSSQSITCETLLYFHEAVFEHEEIIDMNEYIEINQDDLSIYGFPFYMTYIDHFGNNNASQTESNTEVGFVVISFTESYLDDIYWAFYVSWIILFVTIATSCIIVCCNVKTDQKRQKQNIPSGLRAASIQTVRKRESMLALNLFPSSQTSRGRAGSQHNKINEVIKEEKEEEESFSITQGTNDRPDDKYVHVPGPSTDEAMHLAVALGSKTPLDTEHKDTKANDDNILKLPTYDSNASLVADDKPEYNRVDTAETTASLNLKDTTTNSVPDSVASGSNKLKKTVSFNSKLSALNSMSAPKPTSHSDLPGLVRTGSMVVDRYSSKYCNCSPSTIIIVCVIAITITFLMLIGVWMYATGKTSSLLIDDLMVKQEYLAVSDEVLKIFDSTDIIYDYLTNSLKKGKLVIDHTSLNVNETRSALRNADKLFSKLMTTFTEPNGKFRQHYIYIASSSGTFHGAKWKYSASDASLAIGSRVITNIGLNAYKLYDVNADSGARVNDVNDYYDEINLFDPRCQQWYMNAVKHGFVGTIDGAFSQTGFETFYNDEKTPALQSSLCQNAKSVYIELFNLSSFLIADEYINLSSAESRSFVLNEDKSSDELYTITWERYVFTTLLQQGLSASAVITDDLSGDLLAVIGVDYTLNDLSAALSESVGDERSDWYAWIFEADTNSTIASSDGLVLISAASIDGCSQLAETDEQIPISATKHNNTMIRIMSKEIVAVYGIDTVPNISSTLEEPMTPKIPIDLPKLVVGRMKYYADAAKQEDSVDWIIVKTINTSEIESGESNDFTITFMALCMLVTVTMITFREFKVGSKRNNNSDESTINVHDFSPKSEYDEEDLEELRYDEGDRLGYFKKMKKMKHIVEGSANVLWKLACDDFEGIITTKQAKDFMAQRANQHVSANENNSFMFLMCALEYRNRWTRLKFFEIMDSNWYSISMQFIIILHTICTIFEPSTPAELRRNGTEEGIVIIIAVCILVEFCDLSAIGCQRYMEFTLNPAVLKQLYQLNFGIEHKYCKNLRKHNDSRWWLIFFGPKSIRFRCHCIVFILIFLNFVMQITILKSPFSYYLPILPLFIIIKNAHILSFLSEFFFAINFARDVLFSYLCFILIFAMFGISLFGKTVRVNESADSFRSIRQAFITSFVYISTSENYDDIVYATIASDYYASNHWVILANVILICIIFVVLGLFIFIPMIIHKFEEGFSEKKILTEADRNNERMNAIIAAFIMLDMNGDMGIDMDEFQHLVTHSILVGKNKMMADAFNYFDDDGSEELDLYEFTNHLLTQQFRDKLFVTKPQMQNKVQAWLECNVFRRYRFHILILIVFVMPAFTISLLQELKRVNDVALNAVLGISFFLNWVEIHMRWFSFGYRRFFDLKRYPNPAYVVAAISKYTKNVAMDADADDLIIRLSSSQRKWAVHHLRDTRPLSILEKSTLSIIHRIEFAVIWFTFLFWFVLTITFEPTQLQLGGPPTNTQGYQRYFLQLGILIRVFTLLRSNQKIIYMIVTVFSAFASLFAFLFVLIYMFARVGCTLFGQRLDTVIDDIYPVSSSIIASFDTTGSAMLTLLQLMIGEGWHEVMYHEVIAQNVLYSLYFIVYILIVTIIISNVFVGLFLSDVDELKKSTSDDELKKKFNKSKNFKQYALNKLEKLNYQLSKLKTHETKMKKQIIQIQDLLLTQKINDMQKQQLAGIQQINKISQNTQFNVIQEES